jgi:dTDP-4-amino-4,6-dideoxygalactose transaminase
MHLQPVFRDAPARVDGTSERLFRTGLCLPSGSSLSDADQDRVIERILERAVAGRA